MKTFKVFFFGIILLLSIQPLTAQSISVSGGGQWTLEANETTHAFRFWISYYTGGLQTTSLHYKVDGGSQVPTNPVGNGSNNPSYVDITLGEGDHSIEFIWYGYDWGDLSWFTADTETKSSIVKFNVYVTNIFDGGNVSIDNQNRPSGSAKTVVSGNSIGIGAIEQSYGGYNWVWSSSGSYTSEWLRKKYQGGISSESSSQSTSYSVATDDNATTLEAGLRKVCNLTFTSAGGTVYVNGSHSSPYTTQVVEQNSVNATANGYSSNGLDYTFSYWNNNPNSNNIIASAHTTYTAVYIGKPSNYGKNFAFNGDIGDPINFTWTDNPDTSVTQYQIWRRVKHNGILGDATLLATVDRGVETYTDEYSFTDGYTADMLSYDVRAHYEPDDTYSDPQWNIAYGELLAKINENSIAVQTITNEVPTDYSITNYPNPFNPTTTINYQLPENGFVTIKVYDMLGKEIATLVDGNKTAGYHNVTFDASRLTSGIYIYTITANNFVQSKKMLLMK
jgi:hypothetical protein